jgi:hypothetical protein
MRLRLYPKSGAISATLALPDCAPAVLHELTAQTLLCTSRGTHAWGSCDEKKSFRTRNRKSIAERKERRVFETSIFRSIGFSLHGMLKT